MRAEDKRGQLDAMCSRARTVISLGVSQRRMAEIEWEIWQLAGEIDGGEPAKWMRDRFGTTSEQYTCRAALFEAGAAAEALWTAIETGSLSLDSAARVLGAAKDLADSGTVEDLTLAVKLQLDERPPEPSKPEPPPEPPPPAPKPRRSHRSKKIPLQARKANSSAGGIASAKLRKERYGTAQPARNGQAEGDKASPQARRSRAGLKPVPPREPASLEAPKKPARRRRNGAQPLDAAVEQTRQFRQQVRTTLSALIGQYMDQRPAAPDEASFPYDQARQRLRDWIDEGISNFFHDLRKATRDADDHKLNKIGRVRFKQACEVLAIGRVGKKKEPIFFGHKLSPSLAQEFFDLVRERHHIRSRDLHADRIQARSGRAPNPAELAEFQAIQQAREVLEEYIHQMTVR